MEKQPLDTILAELEADDWLIAACAIRKLIPHGEAATVALPVLFEMTLHDKAPIAGDSRSLIKRLGRYAVPFLRSKAADESPRRRAMVVALLTETGLRYATSTRLAEQILGPRSDELPNWGTDPEEMFELFRNSLDDESLDVRFNGASALEEFGRHLAEAVPVFVEALQSGRQPQQNWAALHLGRIGPPAIAATDALMSVTLSECRYTVLAAANALKRISGVE